MAEAECKQCFEMSDGSIKLCYECLEVKNKALEALRDTISVSCNPPDNCNDPAVLKIYMKACFDEASKLY